MKPEDQIKAAVRAYVEARDNLMKVRREIFRPGLKVTVTAENYYGPGVVERDWQCTPDKIPVRIPNGNVWWYPLEDCRPKGPKTRNANGTPPATL